MFEMDKSTAPQARVFIAFPVSTQEFCIDAMCLREIRGWMPMVVQQDAPSFVRGIIRLGGMVVPIVDLAARLGFPATVPTRRHAIIVSQAGNQILGLLVDAISDILDTNEDMIQPTTDIASDARLFVSGVLAIEGRWVHLIDINTLLPVTATGAGEKRPSQVGAAAP